MNLLNIFYISCWDEKISVSIKVHEDSAGDVNFPTLQFLTTLIEFLISGKFLHRK